uniref:Uncharacterized protein n=1 Tax=Meloidogyne enterolobii TaxID=390850 RepID=A0A6V7WIR2_MELEN|nr:unnamed protein product [Meloidogyne enterolobii]
MSELELINLGKLSKQQRLTKDNNNINILERISEKEESFYESNYCKSEEEKKLLSPSIKSSTKNNLLAICENKTIIKLNNEIEEEEEEKELINLNGKNFKNNLPDNEWFISLFLRSLQNERKLKWWKFPKKTEQEEFTIPICWLLLIIGFITNSWTIFSSQFIQFLILIENEKPIQKLFIFILIFINSFAIFGVYFQFLLLDIYYIIYF